MAFEKGREKTGGRKPGSTNRTTADIRSRIVALIDNKFDVIQDDLEALEPKDRIASYMKQLEYVLPKQGD